MKFSIIITTYNRLTLLKRAIDSALAQTIPCQVIVVDDGSSDGTDTYMQKRQQELLARGDTRLIYHRNSTNLGHSESVNKGVELATANWVKLVDDDDYLAPNCLEEIAQAIAQYPNAVIVSCRAIQVNSQEQEVRKSRQVSQRKLLYIPQGDIHYAMLLELLPFGTPVQVAFSRQAFLESGGWDSRFDSNYDDIDSWIKIAKLGDAVFINKCLAYRTVWHGSCSYQLTWESRLETNLLIKEEIYSLVHPKHRHSLPRFADIKTSLKLHWGFAALKKGNIIKAIKIWSKTECSMPGLHLFLKRLMATKVLEELLGRSQQDAIEFTNKNERILI